MHRAALLCLVLLGWLLPLGGAWGHALSPMLLAIEAHGDGRYALEWHRAPADAWAARVRPGLPSSCRSISDWAESSPDGMRIVSRAEAVCDGAPESLRFIIPGLQQHPGTVIVRVAGQNGRSASLLLSGDRDRFALSELQGASRTALAGDYLAMGFVHLMGPDHLLFVIGLFLLVQGLRSLLWVTAAFTLGHSVTLALTTLGWLSIPQPLAELGIAVSIVLLGLQVLRRQRGEGSGVWAMQPIRFAAFFGLLHGLGFAGALAEVGLPPGDVPLALLSFNLGIEFGQLAVIVPLWALRRWHQRRLPSPAQPAGFGQRPPRWMGGVAYGIGALGAFWCIDRALILFAFV